MNSPLISHLCASQIELGDNEQSVFSLKYVRRHSVNFLANSLSVSNEASRCQILVCVV